MGQSHIISSDGTALPAAPNENLGHIPGERGWPWIGHFPEYISNPSGFLQRMYDAYGPVFRGRALWHSSVFLLGAEANQLVMQDREHNFSNQAGWNFTLGELFPRGLMLRDFDDHRFHRRVMQSAFRKEALQAYFGLMSKLIERRLDGWKGRGEFHFYHTIKRLTLDLAAAVFLGIELENKAKDVNRAFIDMVAASITPVRRAWPGFPYHRGIKGRQYLARFFAELIAARRSRPTDDLLGQLCSAESQEGERFSDDEIIDHMIFLMMAAHDTTTSALTSMVYSLGKNPQWQSQLRSEADSHWDSDSYESIGQLDLHDQVFKESLRLYTPVPQLPRRCLRSFSFGGHEIPANTAVVLAPGFVHHMEALWPDPNRFDPSRFASTASKPHPFAWVPFGGGAHMCIGLHFAGMQVKSVIAPLLKRFEIQLPESYRMRHAEVPIPKPKDGLPITFKTLN